LVWQGRTGRSKTEVLETGKVDDRKVKDREVDEAFYFWRTKTQILVTGTGRWMVEERKVDDEERKVEAADDWSKPKVRHV